MKKLIFGALLFLVAPATAFGAIMGVTFSAQPTSGQAPLTVMFYSNFLAEVDFGDGSSSMMQQDCATGLNGSVTCVSESYFVRHVYNSAGTYTAKLQGTYCPDSGTALCAQVITTLGTATVTVGGGSTSNPTFSASPSSGSAPLTVTFSPSSGFSGYYAVNFGDGTSATLRSGSTSHTYSAPGTYTASFVSDAQCLYTQPLCAFLGQSYGSVNVTVTQNSGTQNSWTNPDTSWWWNPGSYFGCNNGYVYQNGFCVYQQTPSSTGLSCSAITYNLSRGMRDSYANGPIVQLQRFLAARYGLNQNDVVTGYFGPLTQSYVMAFQREQGLDQVGIVGPLTRAAIWNLCR